MSELIEANVREERRARARADRTDRLLSASAGVVAVSALVVSIYQTYITREQQKMSVWPYLTLAHSQSGGDTATYEFRVGNEGVGPALVGSVEVLADRKPRGSWGAVAQAFGVSLSGGEGVQQSYYSSFHRGSVVLPGTDKMLLSMRGPASMTYWRAAQTRFRMRVCYCSLYGDCWLNDSEADQPAPVPACERMPAASVWEED